MLKFSRYIEQRDFENTLEETAWMMASRGIDPINYIYEFLNYATWLETNPPDTTGDLTGSMQNSQQPSPTAVIKHSMGGMPNQNSQPAPTQSDAQNLYMQALQALKLLSDKLPSESQGLVTGLHAQLAAQGQQIVGAMSQAGQPKAQPQVSSKPVPAGSNTSMQPTAPNMGTNIPTAQG